MPVEKQKILKPWEKPLSMPVAVPKPTSKKKGKKGKELVEKE